MSQPAFALGPYLARIGVAVPAGADLETLCALHLGHRTSIPFENLDIQLGERIRLDIGSLQDKLVTRRRGGYCFEHNTLLMHALRTLGFEVDPCEARVRPPGATRTTARTHMVLVAHVDDTDWLLDVGFGGSGPLLPVTMTDEPQDQFGWSYRVVREDAEHVLQWNRPGDWTDLYAFVPEPRYPVDFEVGNWYTSTHPESRFVTTLTVQQATTEARLVLNNLTFTRSTPRSEESRELDRGELVAFLAETFGLELPAGARLRALDEEG